MTAPSSITRLRPMRSINQVAGLMASTVPTTTRPTGSVAYSGAGASNRPWMLPINTIKGAVHMASAWAATRTQTLRGMGYFFL